MMTCSDTWSEQVSKASEYIDFDTVCRTLEITPWDSRVGTYRKAYGKDRQVERQKFVGVVENVACRFFGFHRLALRKSGDGYQVVPADRETWRSAASKIMQTINGFGMFHYDNVDDFLASGPYTPKQAVLNHLHWIAEYSAVHGGHDSPHTEVEMLLCLT